LSLYHDPESNGEVLLYSEKHKLKAAQAYTVCYQVVAYLRAGFELGEKTCGVEHWLEVL
jgi:hypothetical protein